MDTNSIISTFYKEQKLNKQTPQPGEIWELRREVRCPVDFSNKEQDTLFSDVAKQFLTGESPPRYVMIVTVSEPAIETEEEWQIVSVMVVT